MIVTVDGGPDENPRYSKTLDAPLNIFVEMIWMPLILPIQVERRMCPLSTELADVILPHDHFGTHLDGSA